MQFEKTADGKMINLPKPCIDTGMGLERITSVMQGKHDNYEIDLFKNIINEVEKVLISPQSN
jgi:alanyl-tRNA synthetase